mgnify:CR=1 FL=1
MKKLLPLAIISLLFTYACSHDEELNIKKTVDSSSSIVLSKEEVLSIALDNPTDLSDELLKSIVQNGFIQFTNECKTKGEQNINIKKMGKYEISRRLVNCVTKSNPISPVTEKIPIYDIEFERNGTHGKAIVSGDKRAPRILAFIPKYIDSLEKDDVAREALLKQCELSVLNEIEVVQKIKDSLREPTRLKISRQLGISENSLDYDEIKNEISIKSEDGIISTKGVVETPDNPLSGVFPLLLTQWSTSSHPYGRNLGAYYSTTGAQYKYPDENVIAIAQLVAYYQRVKKIDNITMDWNYLLSKPQIFEAVPGERPVGGGEIIPDDPLPLREMVGALVKQIYTPITKEVVTQNSAGNTIVKIVPYVFASTLTSYVEATMPSSVSMEWNIQQVTRGLDTFSPILAFTEISDNILQNTARGTFIIDGYLNCEPEYDGQPNLKYYHVNKGHGGSGDGYFLMDNNSQAISFNDEDDEYLLNSYSLQMIVVR